MRVLVVFACLIINCSYVFGSPSKALYKDRVRLPSLSNQITNGENARRNEYPFQVSFQYDYGLDGMIWSHICGATIITPTFIITAAHCIQTTGNHKAVAGILIQGETIPDRQDRLVVNINSHPMYPGNNAVAAGDIAVAQLESPWIWTDAVQPAALPLPTNPESGKVDLSGWGYLSTYNPVVSTILQRAELSIVNNTRCAGFLIDIFGTSSPLEDTMICTGPTFDNISSCSGDSGGPLVQNGTLLGVVSWSVNPCGYPDAPSVYTRVTSYISWVIQHVTDL